MSDIFWDYLITGLLGFLIGLTELLSRYRDDPLEIFLTPFSWVYILINASASLLALWLLRLFGVTFGFEADPLKMRWVQVLSAGVGAMVIFRSSVFVVRVGDRDVSVGPSSILQVMLDVLDREVDRARARKRAQDVEKIMDGVSFANANVELPIIAFALMQNLSREDQENTHNKILKLTSSNVSDAAKSHALGLALMDAVGDDVLRVAVELYKQRAEGQPPAPAAEQPVTPSVVDRALRARGLISDAGSGESGGASPGEEAQPAEEPAEGDGS